MAATLLESNAWQPHTLPASLHMNASQHACSEGCLLQNGRHGHLRAQLVAEKRWFFHVRQAQSCSVAFAAMLFSDELPGKFCLFTVVHESRWHFEFQFHLFLMTVQTVMIRQIDPLPLDGNIQRPRAWTANES